jgi:cell division protein ZapA
MSESRDVTVTIFGQRYTLRSEGAAGEIEALAADVDARMREAAAGLSGAPADRVAILAALNLADELARERRARTEEGERQETRVGRLLTLLVNEVGNGVAEGYTD